jgi:hypothetical protein
MWHLPRMKKALRTKIPRMKKALRTKKVADGAMSAKDVPWAKNIEVAVSTRRLRSPPPASASALIAAAAVRVDNTPPPTVPADTTDPFDQGLEGPRAGGEAPVKAKGVVSLEVDEVGGEAIERPLSVASYSQPAFAGLNKEHVTRAPPLTWLQRAALRTPLCHKPPRGGQAIDVSFPERLRGAGTEVDAGCGTVR